MSANESNLTVILTLKDRAPFTFRWMAYVNESHFPFRILIADGGLDKNVTEVLSNRHNYPNLDYEYIRYPYDETYSIYHVKKADVLSRVETPFAVFTDNDDFLVCDGLRKSVRFLMENGDFVTCRGETYSFFLEPDLNALYGNSIRYALYRATSLEQEAASERISAHFEQYSTTYYDVHRIDDIRLYFNTLRDYDIKDVTIAELLTSFMTVASGKIKKLPDAYLLRQYHFNTNVFKEDSSIDRFDRMLSEFWSNDFTAFVKTIAAIIVSKDHISEESAVAHVKKGYRKYVAPTLIPNLSKELIQSNPKSAAKSLLSAVLPRKISTVLSDLRKSWKADRDSDPGMVGELYSNQEISRIRKYLTTNSHPHREVED